MRHQQNEDLEGYIRGPHKDGEDVCKMFKFHVPGSQSTPENTIWGWNDTLALYCERCGNLATEHTVIRAPPKPKIKEDKKGREPLPRPAASFNAAGLANPSGSADPTAANPDETAVRKQREAERAAAINLLYGDTGMLDESNDPLAVNARPKPKPAPAPAPAPPPPPPPPPPPAPPPPPEPPQQPTLQPVAAATDLPAATGSADVDPALQDLIARDASANEEFKREVERMIREANRNKELDARASSKAPQSAVAPVAEAKDLKGAAVPMGTFADAAALLRSVGLERYESVFEEEEMDPDTLIEVLQQQGKASLEESLKELGIKSMGHRLKILNALIVQ